MGIVDTMVGVPSDRGAWQRQFDGLIKDSDSQRQRHPAGHLFHALPEVDASDFIEDRGDYVDFLVAEMNKWDIDTALIQVGDGEGWGLRAVQDFPDRFVGSLLVDPNAGQAPLIELRKLVADGAVGAACLFPAGTSPLVATDDASAYPLYALCCELDMPVFINIGVPGPRLPMSTQHADGLDRVCLDFPELIVVTRHGGEPWVKTLIQLMRTHPNLHYSTSAFAPRHYPPAIIDFANQDGTDRVMYGGYFPMALTLERLVTELAIVKLEEHVRQPFVAGNARRILKLI